MLLCTPLHIVFGAVPTLAPGIGTLELVATHAMLLDEIDGLAFDHLGNLFGALEINGANGGVVYIDKTSGTVTPLTMGISRADQIAFDPSSHDFFVTSEESAGSATEQRIYRVTPAYVNGVPVAAGTVVTNLTTTLGINEPEGLVVIENNGSSFGSAGELIVAEDLDPGRILHLTPAGVVTVPVLVPISAGLRRPEGLALGDFNGALTEALYAAETRRHRIVRIESDGTVSVFGDPTVVGLSWPDNVEFGPDGFLYVSEDAIGVPGRIIRIAPDGTHGVFAEGFNAPQGLVFDPFSGDLYLSEQGTDSVYRVRFNVVPVPASLPLLVSAFLLSGFLRRKRAGH
jgi:sugar lactone lactonase YvrE